MKLSIYNADFHNIYRGLRLWRSLNFDASCRLGPLLLDVSITNICNFRCLFCSEHSLLLKENAKSIVLPEKILKKLEIDIDKLNIPEIRISGNGEQLLLNHTMNFIKKSMLSRAINIITNGSTLVKISGDIFQHLNKVTISLNSIEANTHKKIHEYKDPGTFDKIINNVERLLNYHNARNKLQINYVIMKDNLEEFDQIMALCRKWDIPFLIRPINPIFEEHKNNELDTFDKKHLIRKIDSIDNGGYDLKESEKITLSYFKNSLLRECRAEGNRKTHSRLLPCYAGFYGGFIDALGNYRICCLCPKILGNIKEQSFAEIWRGTQATKVRYQAALMDIFQEPICEYCNICPEVHLYSKQFHRVYDKIPFQRQLIIKRMKSFI